MGKTWKWSLSLVTTFHYPELVMWLHTSAKDPGKYRPRMGSEQIGEEQTFLSHGL